jgi:hypothetical protein
MFAVIRRAVGLAAALVCLLPAAAWASDSFSTPSTFSRNGMIVTNTTGATVQQDEPYTALGGDFCDGNEIKSTLWFEFRGTGGPMLVSTSGSEFDTIMAVYEGSPPTANLDFNGNAQDGNVVACNDDRGTNDLDSQINLPSTVNGRRYLLQIGGCSDDNVGQCSAVEPDAGLLRFALVTNDSRLQPETLAVGNGTRTNLGASTGDERTTCGSASFGKTVWFRYVAPANGDVSFSTGSFDTVISAYRGNDFLRCNDNAGQDPNSSEVTFHVDAGQQYLIQVGGKGTGENAQFGGFTYRLGFTRAPVVTPPPPPPPVDPDSDGDGLVDSLDCDDANPKRRAGLPEIRGNKVDEDCSGKAQDYLQVRGRIGRANYSAEASTRLRELFVRRLAAGEKVTITCRGRGCSRKRLTKKFNKARASFNFASSLRRNRPRKGAVLEVRITAPRRIGRVYRYTFRFYNFPKRADLCLRPGAKKPARCL